MTYVIMVPLAVLTSSAALHSSMLVSRSFTVIACKVQICGRSTAIHTKTFTMVKKRTKQPRVAARWAVVHAAEKNGWDLARTVRTTGKSLVFVTRWVTR